METQKLLLHGIFGLTCSSLVYKMKIKEEIDIPKLYKEFDNSILKGLVKK